MIEIGEVERVLDQELAARENGDFEVQLWFRPETVPPLLYVTVYEVRTDTYYPPINVPEPDRAMDIFNHALSYLGEGATGGTGLVRSELDMEVERNLP